MKVLIINEIFGIGSHGKICAEIAKTRAAAGDTVRVAYGRDGRVPEDLKQFAVRIGSDFGVRLHGLKTRIFDRHGFGSYFATKKFLRFAEEFSPDLLLLHNIHGYYIHVGLLFAWIKKHPNLQVEWTLHDCWSFTGHCAHFLVAGCDKWKTGCHDCPEKDRYPASLLFDASRRNYRDKRRAFTGVAHMTLSVSCRWLADLLHESYLSEYPVRIVPNKIDLTVFRPTESVVRQTLGIGNRFFVLGVAMPWTERKGLGDFVALAERLDRRFALVMIGLTEEQIAVMPENVIALGRTQSASELAGYYTAADLFLNLTYEDTFPTVNLEAEACGTPVLSYHTGGAPETLHRPDSFTVPTGELNAVVSKLYDLARKRENG